MAETSDKKDKVGFKTTITQRAYNLTQSQTDLQNKLAELETLTGILSAEVDILQFKCSESQKEIVALKPLTKFVQVFEDRLSDLREDTNESQKEIIVLKPLPKSVRTMQADLEKAKQIILPSKTDFYNLNRQIEGLNQRLSLLESEMRRNGTSLPLRPLVIGSVIGTIVGVSLILTFPTATGSVIVAMSLISLYFLALLLVAGKWLYQRANRSVDKYRREQKNQKHKLVGSDQAGAN